MSKLTWLLLIALCISACTLPPPATTIEPKEAVPTAVESVPSVMPTVSQTPLPTHINPPTATKTPSPTPTPNYFSQTYPLSNNTYVIPPTVRHITAGQATFFFELQTPTQGIFVSRNLHTGTQQQIPLAADKARHTLIIDGVNPGETYSATVLLGSTQTGFEQVAFNQKTWGAVEFKGLPTQYPITIGVLGDASFGDAATQLLIEQMATYPLDFVIHTGDVVYETATDDALGAYANTFFEPFKPLLQRMPVYTVLGNHDYDAVLRFEGAPVYDYIFPAFSDSYFTYPQTRRNNQYYAFAIRDIQFIFLDTHVFAGSAGRAEQDKWLEERLTDSNFRTSIVTFHVAPFSSSVVHSDDSRPVRLSWNWRFEQASVPLVLSGHFHHYERLISNGVTYIVSGGGSSTLYAQGQPLEQSQQYARKTHFVLLQLYETHLHLQAISVRGEILDEAEIVLK